MARAACVISAWLALSASLGEPDRPQVRLASTDRGPGDLNHPVDVVPSSSVRVPADWPLDARGAITCQTCHESVAAGRNSKGPATSRLRLRDHPEEEDPATFCGRCHTSTGPATARNSHWMALAAAHIRTGGQRPEARTHQALDGGTRSCLTCHDGVSADEAPGGEIRSWNGPDDHPVGMMYAASAMGRNGSDLRPVSSLPPAIQLPDGKVSCVSCHDVYSGRPGLLAVTLEGSALCFACHRMD